MFTGNNGFYTSVGITDISGLKAFYSRVIGNEMPLNETSDIGLHCTVMYSKVAPKQPVEELKSLTLLTVNNCEVFEFDFWEGHDKENYFVASLKSDELVAQNERWRLMGAVSSFKDYIPHVTLATGDSALYYQTQLVKLNEALKVSGNIPITASKETIADLKS